MVRGVYINRADAERMTLAVALKRYSEEVTVTKSVTTAQPERNKARRLLEHLGDYSLAAITPNIIANYRDSRLATGDWSIQRHCATGTRVAPPCIHHCDQGVALRPHLYPVANIRKPAPGAGRNRRLAQGEEQLLIKVCSAYSNPILG